MKSEAQKRWEKGPKGRAWRQSEDGKWSLFFTQIKKRYGLTMDQYTALLDKQGELCPICKSDYKKLHVDHDHTTSRVRGLLCIHCNGHLGWLESHLETVLAYIGKAA